MYTFEGVARPVLFEQENPDFPYWGKGSSFLLANSNHYYWITAKHVITNMGGAADMLRIFPADDSRISLPFNENYLIKAEGLDDEDYKDIYALRVDLSEFEGNGDAPLTAQDIEAGIMTAEELSGNDELWIIGYPSESNFVDFDSCTIKNTRSVIRATYQGNSLSQHCHTAKIDTTIRLSDYDGLSGSPVFFLKTVMNGEQQIQFPLIVGMLLRGTATSSLVHFVSSSVIKRLLQLAETDA
ncbi:MAG: serine protease [Deltaproteobacteria bacterium]|nr:serine protease [Deltaproteobacteria bacterium]